MKEELGSPNPIINKDNLKQTLRGESWFYLVAALLVAIIVFGGLFWHLSSLPEVREPEEKPTKEQLIKNQLMKLNELAGETEPLTQEEIEDQIDELNDVTNGSASSADEDVIKNQEDVIKNQLDELNNL